VLAQAFGHQIGQHPFVLRHQNPHISIVIAGRA
jgi:hypothetical protein